MNILKIELRKISKGLIIWNIALCSMLAMYIMFFPSMKDAGFSALANAKINMMPEAIKAAFGMSNMPDLSIYIEYLGYILQYIIIGVSVYALILGTKALSSEEQDKTIEFQMANPISRTQLISYKMLAGFIAVTIMMISLLIISIIGGAMYSKTSYLMETITIIKMSIIPSYIYLFIGFAFSAVFKKSMATPGVALGIFFGSYVIGVMAGVIDKISWLKYISPANYVIASDVLKSNLVDSAKGNFNMTGIYIGMVIVVVSIITTYVVYSKKDMEI